MPPDFLTIGDPHLQISKLDVSEKFCDSTLKVIKEAKPKKTVILGDLFHTFSVLRSEVLTLWNNFIEETKKHTELILLVGNHDQAGANGGTHALEVFKGRRNVFVIDQLTLLDGIYYMPFVREKEQFEIACRALPAGAILFCHQSFEVSKFDNGFYDPHGASMDCIAHLSQVISGHVHLHQSFRNMIHPGTPGQMSFGEAGQQKGIFLGYLDESSQKLIFSEPIELPLPKFHVVERATVAELLAALPEPNPEDSYRLAATGSPQEIDAFWKSEEIKAFRAKVKRLDNATRALRGEDRLKQIKGETLADKLNAFVELQEWRVERARLVAAAGRILQA